MLSTEQQQKAITLLLKRAENALCADCSAKTPCWASLDFGVFVCMNCSGAHRALGPSVTRVKSTKLDSWNREWLQNMQVGNTVLNEYWQSQLTGIARAEKPNVNTPLNQIIKYVNNKYVKRKYVKSDDPIDPLKRIKMPEILKKVQPIKEIVSPLGNKQVKNVKQGDLLSFNYTAGITDKQPANNDSNLICFEGEVSASKEGNLIAFEEPLKSIQNQSMHTQVQSLNNHFSPQLQQNNQPSNEAITFQHLVSNFNTKAQPHNNHFLAGSNNLNFYPQNHYSTQNHFSVPHSLHGMHHGHSLSVGHSNGQGINKEVNYGNWKGESAKITLQTNMDWSVGSKEKQTVSNSWTDEWK